MDPKYTDAEQHQRDFWKAHATEAQNGLLKVKAQAIEREKLERETALKAAEEKRKAEEKALESKVAAVKAGDQIKSFIEDVERAQHLYGPKVTSWEAKTNAINNQVTVYMQITKIGEPRAVAPRTWY